MRSGDVRVAGPEHDLRELFLFEDKRQVHKDRTVSLAGVRYDVDAALVGETVILCFDPHKRGAPVDVWHKGKKVQTARVVDAYANCFVKRQHGDGSSSTQTPPGSALRMRDLARCNKEGA